MGHTQHTSHTFDMNEYFSGQRFVLGGRDFDKEDKCQEQVVIKVADQKHEIKHVRDFWDILRAINGK